MVRSAVAFAVVIATCAVLGIALVASGCLNKPAYECAGSTDCVNGGAQGVCQPDHFCSFMDSSCPSGQRYGDLSGSMGGQCVPIPIDAYIPDAPPDAYVYDARECFGGGGAYQLCFAGMPPMGNLALNGNFNTGTDARCMTPPTNWMTAGQPDACMVLGKAITVQTLTVTGTKPLILLGDTITITGTLDVSSKASGAAGPGLTTTQCGAFVAAPVSDGNGAGGGAGGSFKTLAGDGGRGDAIGSTGGRAAAADSANPAVLRSGCPGQTGGTGTAAAGAPGKGGGVVYLTASKITITGAIHASGAGGASGGLLSGGSGGGSGGMIVLHAAETITATGGRVLANGGGGAAGGSNNMNGNAGSDPNPSTPTTAATGGVGGGAAGGDGFAQGHPATTGSQMNNRGGGGGGGGGGYIQTNIAITGATVSPTATLVP